jgi:hypothetical protein
MEGFRHTNTSVRFPEALLGLSGMALSWSPNINALSKAVRTFL